MTYGVSNTAEGSRLVFARNAKTLAAVEQIDARSDDPEKQMGKIEAQLSGEEEARDEPTTNLIRNTSVFTWRNLSYVVKVPGGERTLLDNVNGFVKPGTLGALMGSSGAGKVSQLDTPVNLSFMPDLACSRRPPCWMFLHNARLRVKSKGRSM
jgi:ABC-type transport system involved in cytochrome bd biosynthesis fused ATPase/permease subunit